MAFEKYKPNTHVSIPEVRLNNTGIAFNVSASKFLKWDRVNVACDKLSGQIAISKADDDEGLRVSRNEKWGNAAIHATGIIKTFDLRRLIGFSFRIEDKKDLLLLIPKGKIKNSEI